MYVVATKHIQGKVTTDKVVSRKLLGYGGSMKNFIFINDATKKFGIATHAPFDEAQLSTPVADLKYNYLALWGALNRTPGTMIPPDKEIMTPPNQ
jgi:hypothetical protein